MHALIREVPRPYSARPAGPARSPRRAPRVGLHLKPGQKGTMQLVAQYGDRLLCVRYRYDPERCKRLTTVEIIVAERDWAPRRPRLRCEQVVGLHVPYADTVTRAQVKQAGGQWHPDLRLWQLPYGHVVALGLTSRVVAPRASTARGQRRPITHPDADAATSS
jgi:hypothetical protein